MPNTMTARAPRVTTNNRRTSSTSPQVTSAIIRGISMAAKTKISEFAKKPNSAQAHLSGSNLVGDMRARPGDPTNRPAITVDTRQEGNKSEIQSRMRHQYDE